MRRMTVRGMRAREKRAYARARVQSAPFTFLLSKENEKCERNLKCMSSLFASLF